MANFIPKAYGTEQITIRVENDVLQQVETAAAQYHVSRNAFVNQCIKYALANMPGRENKEEDQP